MKSKVPLKQSGFTLLEIMVAVSILAVSMLAIMDLHSTSMRLSRRGEELTIAAMLARMQLGEIRLELEKDISKGEFPSENKTMEGSFDEPYNKYKWAATIKKVEIPVPPAPSGEEGEASMDMVMKAFQMVAEKIGEAAREIRLEIKWEEMGEEQSLSVATHIVKM